MNTRPTFFLFPVNHLLHVAKPHGYRLALIENEFGDIPVDDELLSQFIVTEENLEVVNGCICCNVRGDLMGAMDKLWKRRHDFDAIIIETTGMCTFDAFFVIETVLVVMSMCDVCLIVDFLTCICNTHMVCLI